MSMKWLAAAVCCSMPLAAPAFPASAAIGCQATSCRVVPCSRSMSAENGLHQADDAAPPQLDMPAGCDVSMTAAP